jgi:hypothetical protein
VLIKTQTLPTNRPRTPFERETFGEKRSEQAKRGLNHKPDDDNFRKNGCNCTGSGTIYVDEGEYAVRVVGSRGVALFKRRHPFHPRFVCLHLLGVILNV